MTDERLAHRNGGKFYLRIEDTDAKRTVEGAVDTVINVLRYFNIEFDEVQATQTMTSAMPTVRIIRHSV